MTGGMRDPAIWTKVTFWITKEERDAFKQWCETRGISQNNAVLAILRNTVKPMEAKHRPEFTPRTPQPVAKMVETMNGVQPKKEGLVASLEMVRWEAARENDPLFAARVRRLLERVLMRNL